MSSLVTDVEVCVVLGPEIIGTLVVAFMMNLYVPPGWKIPLDVEAFL